MLAIIANFFNLSKYDIVSSFLKHILEKETRQMENNVYRNKYFSPQGILSLKDNLETIKLGNCSKFFIKDDKFLLVLDDFCTYNLSKIFGSAIQRKDAYNEVAKKDIVYSAFNMSLSDKVWEFEFDAINSADSNLPLQISGNLQFTQLHGLSLLADGVFIQEYPDDSNISM